MVHVGREISVVGSRLEGRALGGVACCGAGGTYNDLVGGAVAIAVVVRAVLNVADYAFNVLAAALFVIYVGVQLFFHFVYPSLLGLRCLMPGIRYADITAAMAVRV